MNMLDTDANLAQYALLVDLAERSCAGRVPRDGDKPPVALPAGWTLVGFVTGDDHGVITATEIYFGFLIRDAAGRYVLVIRGTERFLEWVEDGEFGMVEHPLGGRVEVGFWSIYGSLRYEGAPIVTGLAGVVEGSKSPITIVGHSLGAPLATYLTLDLEQAGAAVALRAFASPKPGDARFAAVFDLAVFDYLVTNYELDLVPRLPLLDDFISLIKLRKVTKAGAKAKIGSGLGCRHHVTSYAAMLDYASRADWSECPCVEPTVRTA